MRLTKRFALRSPGLTWLGDGLVRAGLVLTPHGQTYAFSDVVGEFDEPLFTSVWGSTTVTTPALRLRCAVPVGHQVRVRWYELPASCSTRRMVLVPSVGKLARRRKVRCKVLSDHVAVPSVRRLGEALGGGHDLRAGTGCIRRSSSATARNADGRQPMTVEPRHEISHRRSAVQPGLARRVDEHTSACHREQRSCPTHLVDTFARTFGDALQSRPLDAAQPTQRLSLWGWHLLLPVKYPANTPAPAISGMTH
jgi:hypothetical protein